MKTALRVLALLSSLAALGAAGAALAVLAAYHYVAPDLPSVDSLRDVKLQVPLRVYSRDGRLLAEFGDKRRVPLEYDEIPPRVRDAFVAAEDDRFFDHPGVDYQGILRAAWSLAVTRERSQGGSTITMQVARGYFLTPEKRIIRKVKEIFLALMIEDELTKQDILALYRNTIFLGQRAYGVGAAAEVYYGKSVDELTVAEAATIAGVTPAPSNYNPVTDPVAAGNRRAYVLRRMRELGFIAPDEEQAALAEPVGTYVHDPVVAVSAPYVAEMVRQAMVDEYGAQVYQSGFKVTTTIDSRLQTSLVTSLRRALLEYDRRHGYRGPVARVDWSQSGEDGPDALLDQYPVVGDLVPAVVVSVEETEATIHVRDHGETRISLESIEWAAPYLSDNSTGPAPKTAGDVVAAGDVVYMEVVDDGWAFAQLPAVQGASVALDPMDGAVVALSGGFDFFASKFNRVVQARRQAGSSFKPFIYSAALEFGFTPATLINDAPVVFEDAGLDDVWRPENYGRRFYGPTRLREALVRSRNLVSVRLLDAIGVGFAVDYLERFGFSADRLPRNLSLALGSAAVSPLELATGYTVLANGGFLPESYFIQRIEDASGEVLFEADPLVVCVPCEAYLETDDEADTRTGPAPSPRYAPSAGDAEEVLTLDYAGMSTERLAPRVIEPQNVYLIADMMRDVIRRGTGVRAMTLGRTDLSGKTGTTNEFRDAWFSGFNHALVATAWVGFDQERPLGAREAGGTAALPAWIYFMDDALDPVEQRDPQQPPGLVTVRISSESGLLASAGDDGAIFETFRVGHVPEQAEMNEPTVAFPDDVDDDIENNEQLF